MSVEALNSDGTPLCALADLPEPRLVHTMDGNILCGGYETKKSCMKFEAGSWTQYGETLQQERSFHISWRRPDGGIQLMGGSLNGTSEVVRGLQSQNGFEMKYETK